MCSNVDNKVIYYFRQKNTVGKKILFGTVPVQKKSRKLLILADGEHPNNKFISVTSIHISTYMYNVTVMYTVLTI